MPRRRQRQRVARLQLFQELPAFHGFKFTVGSHPIEQFTHRVGQLGATQSAKVSDDLGNQRELATRYRFPAKAYRFGNEWLIWGHLLSMSLITKNLTELPVQRIEKYRLFRYLFLFLRGVTVAACCSRLGPVGG